MSYYCLTVSTIYSGIPPLPVSQEVASLFAASLARQGLQFHTISCYLSAVRHLQIASGLGAVSRAEWPYLQYVLKGIRRSAASSPKRVRLPITRNIMKKLHEAFAPAGNPSSYDSRLLWAACCLAFFGFLRSGEFTTSALGGRPSICFSDLAVDSNSSPSVIKIHLRRSKTDPFGQGISIFISRTDTILCPVTALLSYLAARPPSTSVESPLFIWQDGSPLSRDQFVQRIRTALNSVGINSANYAGHSFRIGAATTAAQAGIPDHLIKTLGRWESESYQLYIRTPPETLAKVSQSLS